MKHIIKYRWMIALIWLVGAVSLFVFSPNLQELVREKGQITVPEGAPSQEAQELINKLANDGGENTTSTVLVFHDENGLDASQKEEIEKAIAILRDNEKQLGISNLLAFTDDPAIKEQTVTEDGTTIMVPFSVSLENQTIDEARDSLYAAVEGIEVEHRLTGEAYISQDIITNSEEGLKRTEIITVGLILIILFVVFRSLVAPFIPLLTVGISYLAAQGVVAILADTVHFPLSTFTQIFMVVVMFGIGTDYCILLISRFKEEIAKHDSVKDAVITTYKSGGKTIFYSGIVVLIGFSTIGFSTFSLYQSAVAVAVGVAVVLIAIATLVPFFLVVLGKKLFWPFDKKVEHKESKIWGIAGNFAWRRPFYALLIIAVIIIPPLLRYEGLTSYDSVAEIGDRYESVEGFNWIADGFGPGQMMPVTVVMETEDKIDSTSDFQDIASITKELADMDGVETVRSATRPTGEMIEDFLVDRQSALLADGIIQSTDGLSEINGGLTEASSEISHAGPKLDEAKSGVEQLMQGTQDANHGIGDIQNALVEIQNAISSGAQGAGEILTNLQTVKSNLDDTISSNQQLLEGYQATAAGLSEFGSDISLEGFDKMIDVLEGAKTNTGKVFQSAVTSNPELQQNQEFMTAYMTSIGQIDGVIAGIGQVKEQLGVLATAKTQLEDQVVGPLEQLNENFAKTIAGQEQLSTGIDELMNGIQTLESGLDQAADGQGQVVSNIPSLEDGLAHIYGGHEELGNAFMMMQDQLGELSGGLGDAADGLGQIDEGLTQVGEYLGEFDFQESIEIIPEEALEDESFQEGTEMYLSDNKDITKFEVVLDVSPYSTEAIDMIDTISAVAADATDDTIFSESKPLLGGMSSTNHDLKNISDEDFYRTIILMVIGIFVMLMILLRSVIMPIYLIGSLILTYFTSMGVTEFIFVNLLGYDGLTWAIPFFAFAMLMALGIDYSIFLMDRFNEYKEVKIMNALLDSMKNMGTVIISAAIILGGTFGAMLPSGVLSLLQVATVVLTGLFLYAFVMLPLFVPIMVRLFGKHNWWPFKHQMKEE